MIYHMAIHACELCLFGHPGQAPPPSPGTPMEQSGHAALGAAVTILVVWILFNMLTSKGKGKK